MAEATVPIHVRLPIGLNRGVLAILDASNTVGHATFRLTISEVVIRALVMYVQRCGHDPGVIQDIQDAKAAQAAVRSLEDRERLSLARQADLQQALDLALRELAGKKDKEDENVVGRVVAAHEAIFKPSERAELERAKMLAQKPGPFQDKLRELADFEARKVPGIGATPFHARLRVAFGSYVAAVEALSPRAVA